MQKSDGIAPTTLMKIVVTEIAGEEDHGMTLCYHFWTDRKENEKEGALVHKVVRRGHWSEANS